MDALLFDMDGVLIDSVDFWIPSKEAELLDQLGNDDITVAETTGMNYREMYDYLDENYDLEMDREAFADHLRTERDEKRIEPDFLD